MISRVLVPVDGSEMATRALEYALEVHPDADVTVLYVVGEPSPMMGKALNVVLEEDTEQAAEDLAADVFNRPTNSRRSTASKSTPPSEWGGRRATSWTARRSSTSW